MLLLIIRPAATVVAAPFIDIALDEVWILLLSISRLATVIDPETVVVALARAAGAVVAAAVDAPPETTIPNTVVSDVTDDTFLPVPLPLMLQFLIFTLSDVVISVDNATLITEVYVTVFAAVFVMVRFL